MADDPSSSLLTDPLADPLSWREIKALSLAEMEAIAADAFRRLPDPFRALCNDVVIRVDDFPADVVVAEMNLKSEFDILGLFQGVGLPFRETATMAMPNMIWLYRRPILDYWAEHAETLGTIITHVLVHEIVHHFGLSDDDMEAIEASVQ